MTNGLFMFYRSWKFNMTVTATGDESSAMTITGFLFRIVLQDPAMVITVNNVKVTLKEILMIQDGKLGMYLT